MGLATSFAVIGTRWSLRSWRANHRKGNTAVVMRRCGERAAGVNHDELGSCDLVGGQVDWMMKTSWPRTFSLILMHDSPSGKLVTVALAQRARRWAKQIFPQTEGTVGIAREFLGRDSSLARDVGATASEEDFATSSCSLGAPTRNSSGSRWLTWSSCAFSM